jgi:hypothetical protein
MELAVEGRHGAGTAFATKAENVVYLRFQINRGDRSIDARHVGSNAMRAP